MYNNNNDVRSTQTEAVNAVTTIRSSASVSDANKLKTVNSAEFANLIYTPHVAVATPTTSTTTTLNLAQLANATIDGTKCYLAAQPFQSAQPTYNYALVNQASNYKCDLCSASFAHVAFLNSHKRTIHHIEPGLTDNHVAVVSANGQQITVQLTNSATPQIQIVTASDSIRYSCDECGLSYSTQTDLKNHKLVNHQLIFSTESGVKISKICKGCGIQVPLNLKKDDSADVKCDSCFRKEYHSTEHKGVIQETEMPRIYLLTTPTVSEDNVANSTIKYESIDSASNEPVTIQPQQTVQQSVEPEDVQIKAYPVKRRGGATVTKCHKCNGSGVIYLGGLNNDTSPTQEKPYTCNICNGTFSRYSSLWSHKRLHTGEKNFHCKICGLSFAKAAYLKNHQRIHTGEKPYHCNVCGMRFAQSPHLKNHERIHSGERPYVCEVCDKTFARHSTLWNHRRIHTGEKPYCCDICYSRFNQATHLKNHAKVHSGEKPFRCDICSISFSDRFALKRHLSVHEKYGKTKPTEGTDSSCITVANDGTTETATSTSTPSPTMLIKMENVNGQDTTAAVSCTLQPNIVAQSQCHSVLQTEN